MLLRDSRCIGSLPRPRHSRARASRVVIIRSIRYVQSVREATRMHEEEPPVHASIVERLGTALSSA